MKSSNATPVLALVSRDGCRVGRRLRAALTCLADNSRHASAWAAHVYDKAKARGCDHPHAVRILGRAWANIIWRCWQDGVAYNPTRHNALQRVLNEHAANAA